MPITKSAKKALRASKRKRVFNLRRKAMLKDAIRGAKEVVVSKKGDAKEALAKAYQAIDKAAKRGLIKKNTAARKKSRVAAMIKKAK